MKHTPTPWVIDGHSMASIIRLQFPVGHPDCKHITGTYENIARCEGENWKANAKFIVRACNAHDDLVCANKNLRQRIGDAYEQLALIANCPDEHRHADVLINIAKGALAKARGEA